MREQVGYLLGQQPELQLTLAVLVVQDGAIIAEGYGPDCGVDKTLISWSMAKSMTHALYGLLVKDALIDLDSPAPVAEWAHDARSAITVQQLLNMSSGLQFFEDYVDADKSDCIEMLFGSGQHDVAGYGASLPLEHTPGTVWNYSSGTTNILCRIAGEVLGGAESMHTYLTNRLFEPLGMASAVPKFDAAGTFIGSSFVYATARDFARFGLLYLNDGMVGDQRILPEAWVDHATSAVAYVPDTEPYGYGAHWWLWPELDAFACQGYEGQRIVVVPKKNAVVVRLGKTSADASPAFNEAMHALVRAL